MKIKGDFVTNSSSSSYIMYFPNDVEVDKFTRYVQNLGNNPEYSNCGCSVYETLKTLKELQTFTNDGPIDWAQKPFGPKFWNLDEESYNKVKESIDAGNICILCSIDYEADGAFTNAYNNSILDEVW